VISHVVVRIELLMMSRLEVLLMLVVVLLLIMSRLRLVLYNNKLPFLASAAATRLLYLQFHRDVVSVALLILHLLWSKVTFVLLVRLWLHFLILLLTSSTRVLLLLTRTVACFLAAGLRSFSEVTLAPVAEGIRFFLTTAHRLLKHSLPTRSFSSLLLLNRCFLGLLLTKIFIVFLSGLV